MVVTQERLGAWLVTMDKVVVPVVDAERLAKRALHPDDAETSCLKFPDLTLPDSHSTSGPSAFLPECSPRNQSDGTGPVRHPDVGSCAR